MFSLPPAPNNSLNRSASQHIFYRELDWFRHCVRARLIRALGGYQVITFMISLLKKLLLAGAFVTVACDPGMTIHQTDTANRTIDQILTINVKTTRPFIGGNWYAPDGVTATNLSDKPIMVASVELIANGTTYANKPPGTSKYPLTIAAGKTEALPVWFDLDSSVKRTFEKSAELRVHYRVGDKDLLSSAFLVGGPLD